MSLLLDPMGARFQACGGEAEHGAQQQVSLVSYPQHLRWCQPHGGRPQQISTTARRMIHTHRLVPVPTLIFHFLHPIILPVGSAGLPPLPSRPLSDIWKVTAGYSHAQDHNVGWDIPPCSAGGARNYPKNPSGLSVGACCRIFLATISG